MAQASVDFYRQLKALQNPKSIVEISRFTPVPADWTLILSDVRGSTRAIEAGRYKEINLVGSSVIIAVSNAIKNIAFPYLFGGDGATLLVPSDQIERLRSTLLAVQARAKNEFDLDLRMGIMSAAEIYKRGLTLLVAKFALSKTSSIAMFGGTGFAVAEKTIKDEVEGAKYRLNLNRDAVVTADFDGLECRWKPINASKGEILTLIVSAKNTDETEREKIFAILVKDLEGILGEYREASPVRSETLNLSLNLRDLSAENRLKAVSSSPLERGWGLLTKLFCNCLVRLARIFNVKVGGIDWRNYHEETLLRCDYWKYDNMLRCVVDVNESQKRHLLGYLDHRSAEGTIAYGIHCSKQALMTCLIFDRQGDHVHFIDGGDGGYALAAKQLKEKLK